MGCSQSVTLADKVDYLSKTPFFIHMDEQQLEHFASYFKIRKYQSNTCVFYEGDPGHEFFIIVTGDVDITALDSDKNDQFLSSKKKGDFFGEQGVLTRNHKRTSTVTTTDDCIMLVLTARAYQMYLHEVDPAMAAHVTNIMGEKMLTNLKKIDFLSDISEWKLQLLGNLFRYRTVEKHEVVFEEGDFGRQLFIISQGSVAVTAKDDEGKDVHFSNLEAGRYFGEIALMVDMPRTATVTANERCLLLVLGLDDFRNFLHVVPDLKEKFEKVVKDRTAEHFKKFKVPFFAAIPKERFKELSDLCEIQKFEPQDVIFQEGDVGQAFYLTVFGELYVIKDGKIVGTLGAGRYFGEIALVMDSARTATIVAKTRCVLLSITKDNFSKFFARSPEAYADFAIKLSRQDVPLKSVVVHSLGHDLLKEFLASEYSSENLDFYDMVSQYQNIPADDQQQLSTQSKIIINKFIDPSAEQTINIPAVTRETLLSHIASGEITPHLFNEARNEIMKLMSTDSFKRFKQGPLFRKLLRDVGTYGDNRRSVDEDDDLKLDITDHRDYTNLPGASQPNSARNSARNSPHHSHNDLDED